MRLKKLVTLVFVSTLAFIVNVPHIFAETEADDDDIVKTAVAQTVGNATRGKTLFFQTPTNISGGRACSAAGCHGNYPTVRANKITNGTSGTVIANAIARGTGGMNILAGAWTAQDLADISAFIVNPIPAAIATATIAPNTLTYSAPVNTITSAQTVTLTNTSATTITINSFAITGTNSSEFAATAATGCGGTNTLLANASCQYSVVFKPITTGAKTATLTIAHTAGTGSSTVSLVGTANPAAAPAIILSANSIDYGNQVVNTSSTRTLGITNSGTAALTITGLNYQGPFSGNNCVTTIQPNSTCTQTITFNPTTVGSITGSVSIISNVLGTSPSVTLVGTSTATPAPIIQVSNQAVSFGSVLLNSNQTQTITVTNVGTANLVVSGVNAGGTGVTITNNTCTTVTPDSTCTFGIRFAPSTTTAVSGLVTITSNADPVAISVSGTGTQAATGIPSFSSNTALNFTGVVGQASTTKSVNVVNLGTGPFVITNITTTSDFARTGTCQIGGTVTSSCSIILAYTPTQPGSSASTLVVTTDVGATLMLDITAQATAAATTSALLLPAVLDFGTVDTNKNRALFATIANTGNTPLVNIGYNVTYPFAIGSNTTCTLSLQPGTQCNVEVMFIPNQTGPVQGTLTAVSSATQTPMTISLVGTGSAPAIVVNNAGYGGGFGCTAGPQGYQDFTLLFLLIVALVAATLRKKK